jgi:type IV secretion system protein VirD4
VDVDLEGLSEEDMKTWTLNYIDAQAIPPVRRSSRKQNGQQHERHA